MTVSKEDFYYYAKYILARQFIGASLICIVAFFLFPNDIRSWMIGAIASFLDNCLMLSGVKRGIGRPPETALAVMRRNMFVRILVLTAIVMVMLKLGLSAIGVFISFILLHIVFLIGVTIIANREKNGA